jgi:hypothetical protein
VDVFDEYEFSAKILKLGNAVIIMIIALITIQVFVKVSLVEKWE